MDAPSADGTSIPSSVDPDADPLGVCSQCGTASRRAYSKGLCPACAESTVTELSCGFDCGEPAVVRLPDGKPCCESCGLLIAEALEGD